MEKKQAPLPPDAAQIARRLAMAGAGLCADEASALARDVEALFAAHRVAVYGFCVRFVGNPQKAMDLAQETLLTAFEKLPGFRGEARFDTWLFKIARFKCLNAIRKPGELLAEDGVIVATDPACSALSGLRRNEREELLRASARAVLDPAEQEAVHLRYVENVPLERITALLGLDTASGARGLLQRCKRKLEAEIRRRLQEMGHGSSFVRGSFE